MRKKKYFIEKKEPSLTPAIIIINVLIAGVLVLMGFFIYRFITEDNNAVPYREPLGNEQLIINNEQSEPPEEPDVEPEPDEPPLTMTVADTTPPPFPQPGLTDAFISGGFDEFFFEHDLFIGDSIMTGISHYGYIPAANVFAKTGLNLARAATTEINGNTVISKIETLKPERIIIMLGTNEIGHNTPEVLSSRMDSFLDTLQSTADDSEIIILTIPPVTAAHEQKGPEDMNGINAYNDLLIKLTAEKGVSLIDFCAVLKDSTGYFASEYAETDGLHFKSDTYKVMLSLIQSSLRQ